MRGAVDIRPDYPGSGSVFKAPGLHVDRMRDWGPMAAATFERQGGEGLWFSSRHRLVLPLTDLGAVTCRIDAGRRVHRNYQSGAMAFYPAGVFVEITHGPGCFAHVLLDSAAVRDIGCDLGRPSGSSIEPIMQYKDALTAEIVRTLANEIEAGLASRLLLDSLRNALVVRLLGCTGPSSVRLDCERGLSRERLQRVFDYIEANLGNELTLSEVAGVACFTPTYFSRSFKLAAGVGLSRFVMQRRTARAKTLLGQPRQSLASIAQAVGFSDQSYFTSVFRRETGMTPGQYRASLA